MEPFKNLLGFKAARSISDALIRAYPKFDADRFLRGLKKELEPLELKARMLRLTDRLTEVLPDSPRRTFPILIEALEAGAAEGEGLSGFPVWPLTQYIATHGQGEFELSMNALREMTRRFSAEFAIRYFLISNEARTLKQMIAWTEDRDEHIRRLASEGSRPLLPWGQKLVSFVADPNKTWPILERLRGDGSLYVRTSVANHLNDHTKNHDDWVFERLKTWDLSNATPELKWILRRGLRTCVKRGDARALAIFGVGTVAVKVLSAELLTKRLIAGGALETRVTLSNPSDRIGKVIVDHEIHLLRANGRHGKKVFKGRILELAPGEKRTVEFRIPLRIVTTRKYYPGKQGWSLITNGVRSSIQWFELRLR